jgi:transcriptional regulator with XRE-family HTH domain
MINRALRLIRVFEGLTQAEAAGKIGISQSYVSEIERGTKVPTLDVIESYSRVFDIPASAIMLFSENLADGSSVERARTLVAGKVLDLMQFLERRASHVDVE